MDLIKENWEKPPSTSKNKVQYVMDLRAKPDSTGELTPGPGASAATIQQRVVDGAERRVPLCLTGCETSLPAFLSRQQESLPGLCVQASSVFTGKGRNLELTLTEPAGAGPRSGLLQMRAPPSAGAEHLTLGSTVTQMQCDDTAARSQ
ncbi:hypothetical protein NHX12_003603 [Muraenolepis orangiensis]|uniref:Uncharacterized protein n=1 Tax=Muraenolepis orangiensis TaxID=630683 RepID=A0A9Q0DZI9_9TELE|nr:hypothetical protein NHX12_003603 [Muraenolepis orangiensis]